MSRIGKKPIVLPADVKAEVKDGILTVSSGKKTLTQQIHPKVKVLVSEKEIVIEVGNKESKKEKALWGLFRSLVQNMVMGVSKGFEKKLELNGVGYKVAVQGQKLVFALGFSHPVEVEIPTDLQISVEKNLITVSGADKQKVGQFAAEVRELKKPEPYKGKGIKYIDEVIIRKAGKVVKTVGGK